MKITQTSIVSINIGDRFRKDMGDISGLAVAIKEKGLLQPISIDSRKNLLAGRRRLAACESLGWEKIPAITFDAPEEVDAREIELMENIARKDMNWDERARLESYIFDLKVEKDSDWTMDKQSEMTGKSRGAVSRRLHLAKVLDIIPDLSKCKTEDEAWKQYKKLEEKAIVKKLRETAPILPKGPSKYAKDHFRIADTLVELPKISSDVVGFAEVDPPYAIDLDKRKGGRNVEAADLDRYNEIDVKEYPGFIAAIATEVYRILSNHTFCIWWFGYSDKPSWYEVVRSILIKADFKVNPIPAIWVKGQVGQTASPDTMLGSAYEPFFICRKGMPKMVRAGRSNIFDYSPVPPQKKIHPTEKPLGLMLDIIDTFVWPGSVVMVPFLGGGVTLRAAYMRDLSGFGYDLDEMNKGRFLDAVHMDDRRRKEEEEEKEDE